MEERQRRSETANAPRNRNMEAQRFWHLSVMSSWMFVFFLPSAGPFSQMEPQILLESTVFVAFAGDELHIKYTLKIPENHTSEILTCSDPFDTRINKIDIPAGQPEDVKGILDLKNLTLSGEYSCQYKDAKVYWYLRVRSEGYKEPADSTEFIITVSLTVILLLFSVIGSLFVFRGYWKECIKECGNTCRKQEQNGAEKQQEDMGENNVDVMTASSTSFYASLDPRPDQGSIYDVLDCYPVNTDQGNAKPKKQETKNTMMQSTKPQHEDVSESVYENY